MASQSQGGEGWIRGLQAQVEDAILIGTLPSYVSALCTGGIIAASESGRQIVLLTCSMSTTGCFVVCWSLFLSVGQVGIRREKLISLLLVWGLALSRTPG